jgi:hypothetical protein
MTSIQIDDVIEKYVTIRQIKRDLERDHEESLKPVNEKLEKIEIWLLAKMQETGVDSFKTQFGTAYKTVKTSCTMADSNVFKEFVFQPIVDWLRETFSIEISPDTLLVVPKWNLVDFRALKSGVELYNEDHGQIPPGLNVTQTTTVNVRSK